MAPQRDSVIEDDEYFRVQINERSVDDISLDFFYKPHTITLLVTCISGLLYFACTRDESSQEENVLTGIFCVIFFFLIISVLAFPNGPFTRPHPALWRIVFGLSVLYFLLLLFILFQTREDVMRAIVWLYPELKDAGPDTKEYAINCSDITVHRLVGSMDVFILCHFFGWLTKALLIRHYGILWTMSVMWEVTEIAFAHLLPNFAECWWDSWVLDILLCNGMGIWIGMVVCRKLEIRDYHWESIKNIHSTTGKLKRAAMQFTPASWLNVKWMDPQSASMRILAVWILIVAFQLSELNTFFLKHIFFVPPPHILNLIRVLLISMFSAPTIRQFYVYVTDARCKRLGTQCWVFCAILLTESIICLKFGAKMFRETVITYVIYWLVIQGLSSFVCLYICTKCAERWNKWKHEDVDSPIRRSKGRRTISNSSDDSCYNYYNVSVDGGDDNDSRPGPTKLGGSDGASGNKGLDNNLNHFATNSRYLARGDPYREGVEGLIDDDLDDDLIHTVTKPASAPSVLSASSKSPSSSSSAYRLRSRRGINGDL